MSRLGVVTVAVAASASVARAQQPAPAPAIADNSFLIEEAYNQERGVVQHISTWVRSLDAESWVYTFTQEWPVSGQRSQLSYTIPLEGGDGTRIGDMALNYRYQLAGAESRAAVAPRVSVLVPTGSAASGAGAGGIGVQVNVPVSVDVAPWLVTHWNAGATVTPAASTTTLSLGTSAIWRLRPALNVLVEMVWTESESVVGPGRTTRRRQLLVSPGVRWAFNFASGLQIVPGIALPQGLGPSRGESAVLLYLSFEHRFQRIAQ